MQRSTQRGPDRPRERDGCGTLHSPESRAEALRGLQTHRKDEQEVGQWRSHEQTNGDLGVV